MTGVATTPAARFLGLAGAILLISASATLGAYYGFTVGAHQHVALGVIFAGAALGGELLKPIAVAGAIDLLRSREFLRAFAYAGLALVCIVYSLAAELSLSAGSRGDMASARQLSADAVVSARERRTRAAAELAELQPARSAAEIEPLITKIKATPGANGCAAQPDGSFARKACSDALVMESEAARAQRRAELAAAITEADRVLSVRAGDPAPSPGASDPLASALSAYASALGRNVKADAIAPWLALIPVLFLELGSALALIVVRAIPPGTVPAFADTAPVGKSVATAAPVPAPEPAAPSFQAVDMADTSRQEPQPRPRRARRADGDDDDAPRKGTRRLGAMADLIREKGGRLQGGQRAIAKVLGVSKSRAHEILHELAAAGSVRLAVGRTGTHVQLINA